MPPPARQARPRAYQDAGQRDKALRDRGLQLRHNEVMLITVFYSVTGGMSSDDDFEDDFEDDDEEESDDDDGDE